VAPHSPAPARAPLGVQWASKTWHQQSCLPLPFLFSEGKPTLIPQSQPVWMFGFRNKIDWIRRTGMGSSETAEKEQDRMQSHHARKPYSPPAATKLTPEQAIKFVMDRTKCTEKEAKDLLESLRKEKKQDAA
jgi:hypothetical protein